MTAFVYQASRPACTATVLCAAIARTSEYEAATCSLVLHLLDIKPNCTHTITKLLWDSKYYNVGVQESGVLGMGLLE